ncbi:MAG TPA: hypothetical protein VMZ53_19810 [Kofleriaceae bacterium]|nr:hypothetical protein [Kofleriaceae bacterium]
MHRLALLATLAAAACTSEPSTDTGQLVRVHDQVFAECQDTADATCSVEVTFTNGQLSALGVYEDGAVTGPVAIATLSESARARLADLIAQIPLESPDTVHDVGCGLAPLRTTNADIAFDHDGMRNFVIEYAAQGPMADFSRYVTDLVTGIRTCNSSDLAFESCQPNVF